MDPALRGMTRGLGELGHVMCLLLRPLCRLPLLRRSLALQLTVAAAMLVGAPVMAVTWDAGLHGWNASASGAAIGAGALLGLVAFWATARCLLIPVRELTAMLHAFRLGQPLVPPAEVQQDEVGALVGEALQTLRETNAHLARRARRDASTGALNRYGLDAELDYLLRREHPGEAVCVALIEIAELGRWEMALGPETVQTARQAIVERIRSKTPPAGAVGALGPSWFAFAASDAPEHLSQRLDALWQTLSQPIDCPGQSLTPTCVLGVAHAQGDESAVGLFHAAEAALLSARAQGGSARVDATETSAHLRDAAALGLALEEAIDNGQIEARFQPRVNATDHRMQSAEALARWEHPQRGPISPATFIPLAYNSGRMVALGRHMLDRSIAAASAWQGAGLDLGVSVNVDAEQLAAATLEADVQAALERHGVAPNHLELELTEASVLADIEGAMHQLSRLRYLGVRIALDDFGTGHSSLGYLGRLPVDRVKIDRGFVAELHTEQGTRIVRAIIDLAHSLSLTATAEGVETHLQARELAELGCDELQGFLFAGAVEAEAITREQRPDGGDTTFTSVS